MFSAVEANTSRQQTGKRNGAVTEENKILRNERQFWAYFSHQSKGTNYVPGHAAVRQTPAQPHSTVVLPVAKGSETLNVAHPLVPSVVSPEKSAIL